MSGPPMKKWPIANKPPPPPSPPQTKKPSPSTIPFAAAELPVTGRHSYPQPSITPPITPSIPAPMPPARARKTTRQENTAKLVAVREEEGKFKWPTDEERDANSKRLAREREENERLEKERGKVDHQNGVEGRGKAQKMELQNVLNPTNEDTMPDEMPRGWQKRGRYDELWDGIEMGVGEMLDNWLEWDEDGQKRPQAQEGEMGGEE